MTKYIGNILTDGAPASYSCVFDGTGDYLQIAYNSALTFGSGNFTVEGWFYSQKTFGSPYPLTGIWHDSSTTPQSWIFFINASGYPTFVIDVSTTDTTVLTSTTLLPLNSWVHLAVVRSGNSWVLYMNGIAVANTTASYTISSGSSWLGIGSYETSPNQFNGYISNLRIVKGTAVYTANFTPPTQLTAISGTSLLTCQQPTIIDVSSNAFAITVNGNTAVSTFTPFPAYRAYNPALGGGTPGMWSLNDAAYAAQTRQWNMYDPYWKNVTLLLNGENAANGAQNNTFLDSSTNNFTITRNGNTTQGTFSPYWNLWSNYFDGTGDYLSVANNTAFGVGTGDFTFECWVNPANWTATVVPVFVVYKTSTGGLWIGKNGSNFVLRASGVADQLTTTTFPTTNTWTHLAVVRSGSTATIYYNGVSIVSGTVTYNFVAEQANIASDSTTNYFTGYISNVRLVKGTALYTSNFTPSNTPLTAVSGTSLLTCQSNRFIDNSSNNFTLTVNGNTSVQRFSPFNPTAAYSASTIGGSGYFDGTGDFLTLTGGVTNGGTGDLCFEFWSFYTGTYAADATAFDSRVSPYTNGFAIVSQNTSGYWSLNFTTYDLLTATPAAKNRWQHVAVTRSGNTFRLFVDGVLQGTLTSSNNLTNTANFIGSSFSNGDNWIGNLSNMRCIKGSIPTAYQTSSTTVGTVVFTPPTAPLTAITNTSLLCNFTNAGIPDAAMMNDLETVGNAQVSTSVKKYGTGSLYFSNPTFPISGGNIINGVYNPVLDFGTGDFTIEMWLYPQSLNSGYNSIFALTTATLYIYSGKLDFWAGGSRVVTGTATLTSGNWYHIAITRSGTSFKMFLNGTQDAAATNSTNISGTNGIRIAQDFYDAGNGAFDGYIDDLRITKGLARYTANFTPPTSSLQNL